MCRPAALRGADPARVAGMLACVPLVALLLSACGLGDSPADASRPVAQAGVLTAGTTVPPASVDDQADPPMATARLGGTQRDYGHDTDGNGLFEQLVVEVVLEVEQAGQVLIDAQLADAQGKPVAWGSLDPLLDRAMPQLSTALATGRHAVPVYFDGAALRADGPYTVRVRLLAAGGAALDRASYTTAQYSRAAFQGLIAQLRGLSDRGVERDRAPGYDALRVAVELELLAAGAVTVQGQLFAGEHFLAEVSQTAQLAAGPHTLALDFAGGPIAADGQDGPYTLYLTVADSHYSESHTHTTQAYRSSDFQSGATRP